MTTEIFLELIRNYGQWCTVAGHSQAMEDDQKFIAADDKRYELLEKIKGVVAQLPLCTGVSAAWCPNCGDCVCDRDAENFHTDEKCPLHAPTSLHAEGVTD